MRTLLLAVLLTASLITGSHAAEPGTRYVIGFEDLPLMAGLEPLSGNVVFDSPEGRIVIALARGSLDRDQVFGFYDRTLSALGWTRQADLSFRREGETLRIEFGQRGPQLTVRYTLLPAL